MPNDSMLNNRGWRRETDRLWREPPGPVAGVVVLLHDADGLTPLDDPAWAAALGAHELAAVAPLAGDPWWTDRPATGDDAPSAESLLLDGIIPWARDRWGDTTPLALAGVGAGAHGALRIAYKRARQFPVVAAWRPAVDCHLLIDRRMPPPAGVSPEAVRSLAARYRDAEACRQDSALLHLHPLGWPRRQWLGCPADDPWWEGADRLRMKLAASGVPFEGELDISPSSAANANDPAVADRVVGWIAAALQAERRRVE
ncbi:hypothetical protein Pla108_23950 [Botrimarina colliarenosi]|uniref:Alpha/beta hydrolase family protein n=1 Tax=Botrimarina colliarenosi TaxID=2528001 RepID=A0A5C6AB17_9BACT|nr:hypothetical protein [Botrimarina colliarenosi]TWT96626.1 hypothetical protein Pla108_23950 [Botrimarina colliarenosi]